MDKKKRLTIIIAAAALLVICAVTIVLVFVIGAQQEKNRVVDAITAEWQQTKQDDQAAFLSELEKRSSYKVIGIEKKEDAFIVTVSISAPDVAAYLKEQPESAWPQERDEEKINRFLCDAVLAAPTAETETVIYAYETKDGFDISFSSDFVERMTGNLNSYFRQLILDSIANGGVTE